MSEEPLPHSEILLYQTEDGRTRIQCRFEQGSLWLTQAQIAELFESSPQNITLHLKAVYREGELNEAATCKEYLQVRIEGGDSKAPPLQSGYYPCGRFPGQEPARHQFRQWATVRVGDDQAVHLVAIHPVGAGDGLHQRVDAHRLAENTAWSSSAQRSP
jgi:hypothetical protein